MATENQEKLILVTGATGTQGGAVLRHLVTEGFRVRALTRDASSDAAQKLADTAGVDVAEGDLNDRASIDAVLDGAWGVYSVQTFFEEGVEAETEQGQRLADAAKDAGVQQFVYSSVGAAERATGIPHFESKWQVEEHIREIGLPHTILRPVFFMNNWRWSKGDWAQGTLHQPLSPTTVLAQVAPDDIGAFAAMAFKDPDTWQGRALELAGDERPMTEIAAALGHAIGREVSYQQVPWDVFEEQAGEEMTVMYRWFEEAGYDPDIGELKNLYPKLTDFDEYLRTASFAQASETA